MNDSKLNCNLVNTEIILSSCPHGVAIRESLPACCLPNQLGTERTQGWRDRPWVSKSSGEPIQGLLPNPQSTLLYKWGTHTECTHCKDALATRLSTSESSRMLEDRL